MKSIILRDKLNIGMKVRLDDLSIHQSVLIDAAIRSKIKNIQGFINMEKDCIEKHLDDEKGYKRTLEFIEHATQELEEYNEILIVLELKNEKPIRLDCYSSETEKMSINTMLRKYKKI